MIHIDVQQGSGEWLAARVGIPTASQFHRIITPKTRKPSAQARDYMHALLAEWAIGALLDSVETSFMDRGTVQEQSAVEWYEFQRDVTVERCGFCLLDDRSAGASPDRFVGEDGLLEIKCPAAKTFVAYLLGAYDHDHTCQVQGQLWVTGRAWADLLIYHPSMPAQIVRMDRDEEFISLLHTSVWQFNAELQAAKQRLLALGVQPDAIVLPRSQDAPTRSLDSMLGPSIP